MTVQVKDKEVVVPGQVLATGLDHLPGKGTYRDGEVIRAAQLGQVVTDGRTLKLMQLSGNYIPRKDDTIIALVTDIAMSGWLVDIRSAWHAMLPLKDATTEYVPKGADLTQYFKVGDYIFTKITNVTTQNLIDLSMRGPGLRKLGEGRMLAVTPCKVPRVIGKKGSMISMIKKATGSQIIVGQNGRVWLHAQEPKLELVAARAVTMIEENSHTPGLTEKIKTFLEKETGQKIEAEK